MLSPRNLRFVLAGTLLLTPTACTGPSKKELSKSETPEERNPGDALIQRRGKVRKNLKDLEELRDSLLDNQATDVYLGGWSVEISTDDGKEITCSGPYLDKASLTISCSGGSVLSSGSEDF